MLGLSRVTRASASSRTWRDMADDKRTGSGGRKKIGRNKDKCKRYASEGRREQNKLRRIRRCNGPKAAAEYESNMRKR